MSYFGHPILSNEDAAAWEARLFEHDEAKEWAAMQRAGRALADAVVRDFGELGGFPLDGKLLVLVGKGHNGGDALIAAEALLARFPSASAEVLMVFGERVLRPLARRAHQALVHAAGRRATLVTQPLPGKSYDLSLDGIFGFQFRPPATPPVVKLAERINALPIRFRAGVDLPSGGIVRADFTYATGIAKTVMLGNPATGRPRFLDLGFFGGDEPGAERVLTAKLLAPLHALRSPQSDKRAFGHVFLFGGSRSYPGAILMSVLAALRSGVGLVTAFVPESLAPAFAARAPEAMWVGWPETPEGSLALEGQALLKTRIERATALVIGPGLGREAETLALVADLVKTSPVPVLLDADALQADVVREAKGPLVVTPHAGEFARIAGGADEKAFVVETGATLVLKGPVTRVVGRAKADVAADAELASSPAPNLTTHHSFFGGPVLARGGSGDLLAGLIGGLLAQTPTEPLLAACRGVVWHGLAADLLARTHGQAAVQITQLLDFLPPALRESADVL
jgi:ADP-dependent NAD(P)H-hydrate dehydratase / NAD(P)H-hydrate epimerase